MAKVSWEACISPFDHGGLGIRPLEHQNQRLLLKWLWRLRTGVPSDFWYKIISASLSISSWRDLSSVSSGQLSNIWRSIQRVCVLNERVWQCFLSNVKVKVVSGLQTHFWTDLWLQKEPLSCTFPSLFRLSV